MSHFSDLIDGRGAEELPEVEDDEGEASWSSGIRQRFMVLV